MGKRRLLRRAIRLPSATGVVLCDPRLRSRIYYRDASLPAGSVWYDIDDPNASGELVILPK